MSGTITVPAGVSDFTVTYPTTTDAIADGGETTSLTVGTKSGTGTITDPAVVNMPAPIPSASFFGLLGLLTILVAAVRKRKVNMK